MDKKTNQKKLKTLDISATLFDNVAFVFFHVMETFSEDSWKCVGSEVEGFSFCCMSYNSAVRRILKRSVTISVG